jgi:hypothetical protein
MRRFSVGEVVTWIPDLLLRLESRGDYRIVAAMPDRDGDHMYRIKSPLEEYERVVKKTYLSNRLAICPKRRQLGSRATAQSHCRLCKPHRRASLDHPVGIGERCRCSSLIRQSA